MRIAPHCDRYVAVDFSPVVLDRLREQSRAVPEVAARVEVLESRADRIDSFHENTFDTVVLSSVVQFFPNISYLSKSAGKKPFTSQDPAATFMLAMSEACHCYRHLRPRWNCFKPRMR